MVIACKPDFSRDAYVSKYPTQTRGVEALFASMSRAPAVQTVTWLTAI